MDLEIETTWSFVFEDDIILDDPGEKPKEQSMLTALNKKKIASTFQTLKGEYKIDPCMCKQLNFIHRLSYFSYHFSL